MTGPGGAPVPVAVFASGGGTNLQALLDHFHGGGSDAARVALLVTDRADAGAVRRARDAGVATRVVEVASRAVDDVARDMLAALADAEVRAIALAGYLRLVPRPVVRAYRHRMLNIHPALLPAFGGKGLYGARVHRAVIDAGCRVSGATVHFVDDEYDTGAIVAQWPVPVLAGDTPAALAARVLCVEHRLYPAAVELLARTLLKGEDPATLARDAIRARDGGCFSFEDDDAPAADEIRAALGLT